MMSTKKRVSHSICGKSSSIYLKHRLLLLLLVVVVVVVAAEVLLVHTV